MLLVAKRDRLARDVMIAAMVERLTEREGGMVLSADGVGNGDGPAAEFMRNMMAAFAQYERALIRSRTRAALAVKQRRGHRTGGVPYGYQLAEDGVELTPDAVEQAVLCWMQELRTEGLSIRQITASLHADDIPSRGSRWHKTTVAALLNRGAA